MHADAKIEIENVNPPDRIERHDFSLTDRVVRTGSWAVTVLLLTSVHHAWGAFVFDTPWRLDILYLVVPSALAILGALWLGCRTRRHALTRFLFWTAAVAILIVPVSLIGVLEGGYNHVVKNAVYFAFGEQQAWQLFPAQFYAEGEVEMPSDLVFELTGVTQFPLGILAGLAAINFLRALHRLEPPTQKSPVAKDSAGL